MRGKRRSRRVVLTTEVIPYIQEHTVCDDKQENTAYDTDMSENNTGKSPDSRQAKRDSKRLIKWTMVTFVEAWCECITCTMVKSALHVVVVRLRFRGVYIRHPADNTNYIVYPGYVSTTV